MKNEKFFNDLQIYWYKLYDFNQSFIINTYTHIHTIVTGIKHHKKIHSDVLTLLV